MTSTSLDHHPRRLPRAIALLLGCLVAAAANAERADREKPINIEANRLSVDDRNKVQTFQGGVVLTQGTLVIRSEKLVVTQDAAGFQKGVATGGEAGLAHLQQKREGRDETVYGEAERIEYDGRDEKARLFVRARVTSGGDEVRGRYIEYDGIAETYVAATAPATTGNSAAPGRVSATLQPRSDDKQPADQPTPEPGAK
jgi:lipopolysaccharide export system protein LptA